MAATKKRSITVHDYTKLSWGWSYMPTGGGKDWWSAVGHGLNLCKGEQILILVKGVPIRYTIIHIEYFPSPNDMWKGAFRRVDEEDNPQEPE